MLETLKAYNSDLCHGRWSEGDIDRLVTPGSGVISSFEKLLHGLARILDQDLADTPLADTSFADRAGEPRS
jgi:hypothetical protein